MKKSSSIIWGVVLIAIGLVVALNALEITNIDIFFDGWWTLLWIVPCTIGLFTEKEKLGNLIAIAIGVFLLLCCQDILDFKMVWKLALPAVIIIIGIKLIVGSVFNHKTEKIIQEFDDEGRVQHSCFSAFSGNNVDFDGQSFYGAKLDAVFGGIKYDLRNAIMTQDCVINACAVFGGIDILLPEDVNVKVISNSLFGGVSNKRSSRSNANAITVYINGTGLFGGVDIK